MFCAELQGRVLAEYQEFRIVAAKRSDKSSTLLQECRFANVHESSFQSAKI